MFSVQTTLGSITILLADALISYLVFWASLFLLPGPSECLIPGALYGHLAFSAFTLIIICSLSTAGLYSSVEHIYPAELLKKIIPAFLVSFASLASLSFFIKDLLLLNWRLIPPLGVIYVCLFVFRYFIFFALPKNRERILILGATEQAREIIEESQRKKKRGYDIVGIITSLESQAGTDFHGVPVLGLMHQVAEILQTHSASSIVVTLRERRGRLPVRELLEFKLKNVHIQEGSNFYEKVKRKLIIDEFLKPSWIIFENGFFHTSLHGSIKRTQGLIVSAVLLAMVSPILLLVAILIRFESSGPVFFRQERVGRNGRIFRLIKFRSMYHESEALNRPAFARKNDPRVTRVGRIIRKIRLDEVPQFLNIFKGDMDLVGPRPEQPYFVRQLEGVVPYYNLRHTVRPGLTGWAQVNYPYGGDLDDGKEKLKYDLYYLKHFSWYLDLLIILMTIKEVLFVRGR